MASQAKIIGQPDKAARLLVLVGCSGAVGAAACGLGKSLRLLVFFKRAILVVYLILW